MSVQPGEREFQGLVLQWGDQIITGDRLAFDTLSQESKLRVGRAVKPPDAVLWLDRASGKAFCEFELKTPEHSPMDADLVANAEAKASHLGAPYFVTWNVNELVLWDRSEVGRRLLERTRHREIVADIRDLDDILNPAVQETLRGALRRLLRRLEDLHLERVRREDLFRAMPPDDNFVDIIHSFVKALAFYFGQAIRGRLSSDRSFRRRLPRWMREQGWSGDITEDGIAKAARQAAHILLNKVIFYDALRGAYERRLPAISIPRGARGDQVRQTLNGYFQRAITIDYEPAFTTHILDEIEFSQEIAGQLRSFSRETSRWEYRELRAEIVGRVFERLIPPEERKWLGQFFTRTDLVDLIIAFCVKSHKGPFVDPACGAGTFLIRLYSRLKYLSPRLSHQDLLNRIWGFDIAAFPAHLSTINLYLRDPTVPAFPRVERRDFFDVRTGKTHFTFPLDPRGALTEKVAVPRFAGVVTNPPYTRQEELEEIQQGPSYKRKILGAIQADFPDAGVRLSGRAGIYAHFFLHGASFLEPGGRLGFVTSNSWLDVGYGGDLQRFFLERFKIVAIIESRCERWFEDAAVNTAITILEECSDAGARESNTVRFVSLKRPLAEVVPAPADAASDRARWRIIDVVAERVEDLRDTFEDEAIRVRTVAQRDLWPEGLDEKTGKYAGAKWGKYLRAPQVYFDVVERARARLIPLSRVAHIRRGITSGANDFFYVKDVTDSLTPEAMQQGGWPHPLPRDVRIIEAGDGSRHLIEAKFLSPVLLRVGDIDKPLFELRSSARKLVNISLPKSRLRGMRALEYVKWGEQPRSGRGRDQSGWAFHERPTCASRDPWYDLGERSAPPILYPIAHKRRPVIGLNRSAVLASDNLIEVRPHEPADTPVIAAALYSVLGLIEAEAAEGRVNFGEGVLKTQPEDVERFLVPDPSRLPAALRSRIESKFAALAERPIALIWEEATRRDRHELDDAILEALGYRDAQQRTRIRQELYRALCDLVSERMQKPKTVKPKRSAAEALDVAAMAQSIAHDEIEDDKRRRFPRDFVPSDCACELRAFPEGEVSIHEGDLFQTPRVWVAEVPHECRSALEARYIAYALRCGENPVAVPTEDAVIGAALREYEAHVREMAPILDAAIKERVTGKRVARAVRKEVFNLLGLVEEIRR